MAPLVRLLKEDGRFAVTVLASGQHTDMLQQAVEALKSGREPDLAATLAHVPEIKLHAPALLPDDYCPDVHERLILYKRLANARDSVELSQLREELIDRFGKLPEAAQTLIESHRLRLMATDIGLAKIDADSDGILLQFDPEPRTPPTQILAFAQARRDTSFAGQDRLRIKVATRTLPSASRRCAASCRRFCPRRQLSRPRLRRCLRERHPTGRQPRRKERWFVHEP